MKPNGNGTQDRGQAAVVLEEVHSFGSYFVTETSFWIGRNANKFVLYKIGNVGSYFAFFRCRIQALYGFLVWAWIYLAHLFKNFPLQFSIQFHDLPRNDDDIKDTLK